MVGNNCDAITFEQSIIGKISSYNNLLHVAPKLLVPSFQHIISLRCPRNRVSDGQTDTHAHTHCQELNRDTFYYVCKYFTVAI